MTGRPTETGRCCGLQMNVGKAKDVRTSKATIPNTDCDRSKTAEECGIFQLFEDDDDK
jgi:hypothetical protein